MTKRSRLWWLSYYAFLLALGTAYIVMVRGAQATETCCDKHIPEQNTITKTVVVVERDHNNALAAVTGGLIAWAIVHHRNKHHERKARK